MASKFSEEAVHAQIWESGISDLISETNAFESQPTEFVTHDEYGDTHFELWRIIKGKTLEKLSRLHTLMSEAELIGSNVQLPIDKTKPMELDFLGRHNDGVFVLELKVDRSAERNAFSELLGYSNYVSELFSLSGAKDITNVLVTPLFAKISRSAFLYDLIISDRNVIIYKPVFPTGELSSLKLEIYVPSDEDFQHLTNELLSHDAMACVVASFHDIEDWIDSNEDNGQLNAYTIKHLEAIGSYCAQLMEAERLHGFCWMRKRWQEIPTYYENALIVCAINPFRVYNPERSEALFNQLGAEQAMSLRESAESGFQGRLLTIAQRALKETLTHNPTVELEMPFWSSMITDMIETVFTHNLGFRPTGILREAYLANISAQFSYEASGGAPRDHSVLKVNDTFNWFAAWDFMEQCGFSGTDGDGDDDDDDGDDCDYDDYEIDYSDDEQNGG